MNPVLSPPLAGMRVIDLTTFLSGPSATQLLADMGAEIIKVESFDGDSSRAIAGPKVDGESAYFLANNRGKQSIALDLKHPDGKKVLDELIATADVLFENFRPGVMARLGFDPDEVMARYPGLIWASISGFGQHGVGNDRPAYDMVVQALSGVMSITGHPGAPAARLGIPAGDVVAGLYAVIGVLGASHARNSDGRGRFVDVSMLQGQLAMLSYQAVYTAVTGVAPGRQGAGHDSIATYRGFRGGDGREFVITANMPRMWEQLCHTVGRSDLLQDERFATAASRLAHKEALWADLEEAFAQANAAEWVERLTQAQVPAALVKDVVEALDDAREANDGTLITVERDGASFENVASPIRFAGHESGTPSYPPALGEHTVAILEDLLGMAPDVVADLLASGAVKARAGVDAAHEPVHPVG